MMTIDHLRVDHRITVLREFSDVKGNGLRVNETGVIRSMKWDQLHNEISINIERDAGERHVNKNVTFYFSLASQTGPRNGHMREYFEMGDYVPVPGSEAVVRDPAIRKMIVPPKQEQSGGSSWWRGARNTAGPDKLEDEEKRLLAEIDHIGVASSIAEMYAQRMRAFQAEGNEERAIAAFRLADDWMRTFAGWATSGGEGAANTYARNQFRAGLVKELGYDPFPEDK